MQGFSYCEGGTRKKVSLVHSTKMIFLSLRFVWSRQRLKVTKKSDRLLYTILLSQGGPLSYIYIATFFLSADLFSKLFHLPWNCFYLTLLSSLQCSQVLLTKKMILHSRFSWQRPHFWPHYQKYDVTWMLSKAFFLKNLSNGRHLMVCYYAMGLGPFVTSM